MKQDQNQTENLEKVLPIQELTEGFISSQDVKISSRNLYRRTLRQFFLWAQNKPQSLDSLTRIDILRYKDDLKTAGLSPLTIGSYLVVVRKFYEWTEANKLYPNIARAIKTPNREQGFKKDPLSIDQIKELLDKIDTTTETGLRDFAILNLLVRTGLRTIEVVRANIEDIQHRNGETILLVQGKGRDSKDNFVILTRKSLDPILAYLRTRGRAKSSEPLFTSSSNNNKGERLTTRTISFIAKQTLRNIGLDSGRLTAHSLRHTAGVNILKAGGDLYSAQLFMRHANPATTQIYLKTIEGELRFKNAPEKLVDTMF